MEIIVDAYGSEEQAMGWYYYLEDQVEFPFTAACTTARAISPLECGDKVEVTGLAPEEECEKEMFVTIQQGKRDLAVPLSQLKVVHANSENTIEAVDDWRY